MGDANNKPNGGLSGNLYELNLYLLFLHRGCRNNIYGFKLHREQENAGKFDDLVFEFPENGATVYRFLQAKHSINPEKRISEKNLFLDKDGPFDLIKYLVSYRTAKKNYATKGQIKDFVICTSRSFDFKLLKIDIEKIKGSDRILDVKSEDKESVKYRLKNPKQIFGKIRGGWKKRMNKWEKDNDDRKDQPEPDEGEIAEFLKHLIFAVDMPNDTDLGTILKDEIGEEFNEITKKDIYNRAFQRMIDWMKANDRRNFWTHDDAKALFEDIKAGFTLPYDVWYNFQSPVSRFTGRKEHLEAIHKLLQDQKCVVICGLGGVGKTELVRKYIEIHSEKYYNNILWINAESDEALGIDFRSLASDKLGIKTKNANGEDKRIKVVIDEVYQWFQQSKSLFIFENAEWEQYPTHIRPSLPKTVREPYIIVTSHKKWNIENINETVELSVFTPSEAIDFIYESLSKFLVNDRQRNGEGKLAETLQYLPLALTQAIAYITAEFRDEPGTNQIAEYVKKFSRASVEYLTFDFSEYNVSGYTKTVWTTWNITVEALKCKEAFSLNVLNCVSFLLSDNIPFELLAKIFLEEGKKLKKSVRLLKEYSLITVREKVYSVHRLVQLVTRKKLERDQKREVLERISGALIESDDVISRNIDHFSSAWSHFKVNRNAYAEEYYHIPATIAIVLSDIDRYEEAFSLGIEALELINHFPIIDEERQRYVQNLTPNVVKVLRNSGKHEEALNKSEELWNIIKDMNKRFPFKVPMLTIENEIIIMYLLMRDTTTACKLLAESALKNDSCLDKYHKIVMLRNEMLTTYLDANFIEYDQALFTYYNLLCKRKGSSKVNDLGILRITKKIAWAIYQEHLYEKAIKLGPEINIPSEFTNEFLSDLQEAYEVQRKTFPNNHCDSLETQENIISLFIVQGKYKEALTLLENISDESLSRNNCSLLTKKATVVAFLNEKERALAICKDLKENKFKLGSGDLKQNHPDLVDCCVEVALVLSLLRKFDEALKILREIWNRLKYSISYYNLYVAKILIIIGHIYLMQDKHVEGLSTFEEVWECYEKEPKLYHWIPLTLRIFIDTFLNERKLNSALRHGLKLIEVYKQSPVPCQESVWKLKNKIAKVFVAKKEYDKALSLLTELKKIPEAFLKKDDSDYQETCNLVIFINHKKKTVVELNQNEMSTTEDPFEAVKRGNLEQLQKLINDGLDVNATDAKKWTLLHRAISAGQIAIMSYLLREGADVTRETGKFQNTVLHIAVTRNHVTSVEILLNHHFDISKTIINARTKVSGTTALHIASRKGFIHMVRLLLAVGATYDMKNKVGKSPLDMARGIVVEELLREVDARFQTFTSPVDNGAFEPLGNCHSKQIRAIFQARNSQGHSLFKLAVANNCRTVVDNFLGLNEDMLVTWDEAPRGFVYFLLDLDESVSSILRSDCMGRVEYVKRVKTLLEPLRPLRSIFKNYYSSTLDDMVDLSAGDELTDGTVKLVEFVVEEIVKKILKTFYGTALLNAAKLGDLEAFKLCLAKHPILDMHDLDGRTAMHYAAEAGNATMIELLLSENSNVCNNFHQYVYPFYLAAKNGHVEVARLLLQANNVCIRPMLQESGDTALHLAARNGHLDMVKLLLENKVDYGMRNNAGHTPPDVAASQEIKDLFGLIDELHADEDVDRVLVRLGEMELAERRPLLNALNADGKQLWQVLDAECTDREKLLDVIGEQIEVDSKVQAELARKLLDLMLKIGANKNKYIVDKC